MGITYIEGWVKGIKRKRERVRFLVNGGVMYTLLPENVWKKIGLKEKRKITFTLADGTTIERKISECHITLPQGESHSPVILGEKDDAALLGVVTLENLGLIFIPFNRTLQPMKMLLM